MSMDWFVFDFVVFSFIDDYDGVFGDWNEFKWGFAWKEREKLKQWWLKILEK